MGLARDEHRQMVRVHKTMRNTLNGPAPFESVLVWFGRGGPPMKTAKERSLARALQSIKRQPGGTLDYDWRDVPCVQTRNPV